MYNAKIKRNEGVNIMSVQSNNQGRAYEFICINTLQEEINKIRKSEIVKNSAYFADERAWNSIDEH